jgi:drug/metabolite transporter (DMT)-like permease
MNVVMVPVVSAILLKKKPDFASVIGVFVAFTGLFVISGGLSISFNIGDFLTLICAVFWTFQIIFIDKFTEKQDAKAIAVLQMIFAAVFHSIFWVATDNKPFDFNLIIIYTILITGVLGTAFAFAGQTIAQKYTTPTRTALIFTAEPVFGAFFAMIIPNSVGITEKLQVYTVVGCILILAGMLISETGLSFKKKVKELQSQDVNM